MRNLESPPAGARWDLGGISAPACLRRSLPIALPPAKHKSDAQNIAQAGEKALVDLKTPFRGRAALV